MLVVKFEGFHVFNHESSPCLCFLIEDNSQNPYKVKSRYIFVLHSRQIKKKSQSSLMKNPVTRAVPAPLFSPMLNCFYFHCLNQTFHRVKVNSKHHFRCKVLTITIKIAHWSAIISLTMYVKLEHLSTDKNVEVDVTSSLIWALRIHSIIGKASRPLGLLKRTCLLLTDVPVRY